MEKQKSDKARTKTGPKRPMSAYNFFFKEEKTKWLNENKKGVMDDGQSGSRFKAMTNAVSSKWKTLSEEEKAPFVKMAEEAMKEYRKIKSAFSEKTLEDAKLLQSTRKRKAEAQPGSLDTEIQQSQNAQPQQRSTFSASQHATSPSLPLGISSLGLNPGLLPQIERPESALQFLPFFSTTNPQQSDLFSRLRFSNPQSVAMPPFLPVPSNHQPSVAPTMLQVPANSSQAALLLQLNALEQQTYRRQLVDNMQLLQNRQELELANRLRESNMLRQLLANRPADAELLPSGSAVSVLEEILRNNATNLPNNSDIPRNSRQP
ncbi:hypothetical protein FisN_16Lh247 [Fistulifera solaris]|uniref:HMG box domain-containing protein n=1 Tax=Fistulifera solaris TaxID=1519565 RepID=A0A1Z5J6Z2_FISSO|nr:hypothetical protein FisN_16Lh247 [Fistulifera solaris]|eukprot:GAX09551.1 hypothetical protein FisN_16Lh247 [Fistulifera solaris]